VAAALVLHLGLLEWLGHHTTHGTGLADMSEPEFNRAMTLGEVRTSDATLADAQATATVLPLSTVGQVVQARTIYPAPKTPRDTPPAPAPTIPPPSAKATKTVAEVEAKAKAEPVETASAPPTTPTAPPRNSTPEPAAPTASSTPQPQPEALHETTPTAAPSAAQTAAPEPPTTDRAAPELATALPSTPTGNFEQKLPYPLVSKGVEATHSEVINRQWLHAWPPSTRLGYQLRGYFRGDLYGNARVQWQRQGDQYQAQVAVNVGLFMDMRLTSQGRITPTQLWPISYQEDRRRKPRLVRMGEQDVVLDNGTHVQRPPGLQDTASLFVQLSQDFATGRRRLVVGEVIEVTLARPGAVEAWTYDVASLDTLSTGLGTVQAYHLKPRPQATTRSGVAVEMWFSPALSHQPVRIRLTLHPDTWLDLTLESATQADDNGVSASGGETAPAPTATER
jgi:hypothetical protein